MRPRVHFTGARGWINDPHGITYSDGRYHLFHQAQPASLGWERSIEWGHATSSDLVTWKHLPAALTPGDGDDGIWSGTLALDAVDGPVIFYTAVGPGALDLARVRTAHPLDPQWRDREKGDVVVGPPEGAAVFRDPMVRPADGGWRMVVGGGLADGTPAVFGYASADLRAWTPTGLVASPAGEIPFPKGAAWECPQVVDVDGRTVLIVSTWRDGVTGEVLAGVGDLDGEHLGVESWQQLSSGGGPYAPTAFVDADGEPCLMFWIREIVDPDGVWAGALSLPYRMSVDGDRLVLTPHPSVVAAAAVDERVLGLTWVGGARPLEIVGDGGRRVAVLERDGQTLRVRTAAREVVMALTRPDLAIDVVLDGPVLEVSSGTAVIALQVPAATPLRPAREDVRAW